MACSCKVKKEVQYVDPLIGTVDTTTIEAVKQEPQEVKAPEPVKRTPQQILKELDVSSTTRPDQLCLNCVRKHIGLARMFVQEAGWTRFWAAAGQLMCAASHLQYEFPNLSYKIADVAVQVIRKQRKSLGMLDQFSLGLSQDPTQDIPQYTPIQITDEQRVLLTLSLVYSLFFVQLTYEEVNKVWATAHLSYTSYMNFRSGNSMETYKELRPLWKLIQSMQPGDQTYLAAREYLQGLLKQKYNKYVKEKQMKQREEQLKAQGSDSQSNT